MHYHDRQRACDAAATTFDLMSSRSPFNVTNLNVRHPIGSNFTCNMLVQPTAAIFRPSTTNHYPYQHNFDRNHHHSSRLNGNIEFQQQHFHPEWQRSLLAHDIQEIMKNRLSKPINITKKNFSSINSNERLTLPTVRGMINVEDEAQVRAFDNMLNNAQLTTNLTTINEQYEQLLSHLLNPYYSPIPASMLLLNNRSVPTAAATMDPQQHQNVLPSHVSTVSCKSIPHADHPVNLEGFRTKRPIDWSMEDVWSWMVSFAEQRKISADYLNMANFVNCTGMKLLTLSRQQFVEMDETYGEALYEEFKKLAESDYAAFDDVIRSSGFPLSRRKSPVAGTSSSALCSPMAAHSSAATPPYCASNSLLNETADDRLTSSVENNHGIYGGQPIRQNGSHSDEPSTSADQRLQAAFDGLLAAAHQQQQTSQLHLGAPLGQQSSPFGRDSVIKTAGCDNGPIAVPGFNPHVSSALQRKLKFKQAQQQSPASYHLAGRAPSPMSKFAYGRICKKPKPNCNSNDDIIMTANGKPRKRSQHTKGNKLWEFIRDALKDPETSPSVVKWEDQEQGVFRIVESERLARLWGRKKNNSKMTYEKLSRAMRTYYEKKILEPVPKTGLYPKKLVYKFGPCAYGWQMTSSSSFMSSPLSTTINPDSLVLPPTDAASSSSSAALAAVAAPTFNDILMAAVVNNGANGMLPPTNSNNHAAISATVDSSSNVQDAAANKNRLNYEMAAALLFSQINAAAAVQQAASPQNFRAVHSRFLANGNSCGDFHNNNDDVGVEKRSTPATTSSNGQQIVVDVKQEIMDDQDEDQSQNDGEFSS
uniref:Uncharacterized protein n=1 Tax=Romanomermis culicivorax TaxID=13658 RepID=A0A915J0S3_ROMCU